MNQPTPYAVGYDDGYHDAMMGLDYDDSDGSSMAYDDGYADGYADGLGDPDWDEWEE